MVSLFRQKRRAFNDEGTIEGNVRLDADIRRLTRKLSSGDIAVIDVMDLDQRTAEAIVSRKPSAVVNAQASISGRFPNGGPQVLNDAGVVLIDNAGADVMALRDGARVKLSGDEILQGFDTIATGVRQTRDSIEEAMQAASDGMNVQLAAFTANAMDHVSRDAAILLDGKGLPEIATDLEGKQVVIVAPGFQHEDQLKAIRAYLNDRRPVIIAVELGADAVMEHAYAPAIIVGNVESVSEAALKSGAEVVLHDIAGGDAGLTRLDSLNVAHVDTDALINTEDLAILMAHAGGAEVIVTVGIQARLLDFLEQGRSDTAGTFMARLQAGGRLVDATTLARVYKHRYSPWTLVALVLAAVFALGNAIWLTPGGSTWIESLWPGLGAWLGGGS